jgi:hypothetical protein
MGPACGYGYDQRHEHPWPEDTDGEVPTPIYVVWCPTRQRYLCSVDCGPYAWTRHLDRARKWTSRDSAQYACDSVRSDYPSAFVYDITSARGSDAHDTPAL